MLKIKKRILLSVEQSHLSVYLWAYSGSGEGLKGAAPSCKDIEKQNLVGSVVFFGSHGVSET